MIKLSKSNFCDFNMKSRLKLIKKDGRLVATRLASFKIYSYYSLYDFKVEVIYDEKIGDIITIELFKCFDFRSFITSSLFDNQ